MYLNIIFDIIKIKYYIKMYRLIFESIYNYYYGKFFGCVAQVPTIILFRHEIITREFLIIIFYVMQATKPVFKGKTPFNIFALTRYEIYVIIILGIIKTLFIFVGQTSFARPKMCYEILEFFEVAMINSCASVNKTKFHIFSNGS